MTGYRGQLHKFGKFFDTVSRHKNNIYKEVYADFHLVLCTMFLGYSVSPPPNQNENVLLQETSYPIFDKLAIFSAKGSRLKST